MRTSDKTGARPYRWKVRAPDGETCVCHGEPLGWSGSHSYCKIKNRARMARWVEANRERKRDADRAYCAANREQRNAKDRQWREDNHEVIVERKRLANAANPEPNRARVARWQREHPERVRAQQVAIQQRRRARLAGVPSDLWTRDDVWSKSAGVCGLCLSPIDPASSWHVDHIVPVSRGGSNLLANVQAAHAFCNISKGPRLRSEVTA